MLMNTKFEWTLIDEATQAFEPEYLLPYLHDPKHAVLIDDHQQISLLVNRTKKEVITHLGLSMFGRFANEEGFSPQLRLKEQYRMHTSIAEFSSNCFYNNSLENCASLP